MNAVFFRLTGVTAKSDALIRCVAAFNNGGDCGEVFTGTTASFAAVPCAPFAYWLPERLRDVFRTMPGLSAVGGSARQGLATTDDSRFVRTWWESWDQNSWVPFQKGGNRTNFYRDVSAVLMWRGSGHQLKALITQRYGSPSKRIYNEDFYGQPGYSWPLRGGAFSAYAAGKGCVFGIAGKMAFVPERWLLPGLALFNSQMFNALINASAGEVGHVQYEAGLIGGMPLPEMMAPEANPLEGLACRAWSLKRSLDTTTETSHAFHIPALLQVPGATVADRASAWSARIVEVEAELARIQAEINDIAFRLYGIDGEDRARIEAESGTHPTPTATEDDTEAADEPNDGEPDEDDDTSTADTATLATELISWAIGVAFGRFDIDYAGGLREPPPEPGPFDPLPARSPGMRPGDDFAVEFLVDDQGHPNDLARRVADIFGHAFGPWHDDRLNEAVHLAGAADLPTFLRRQFFPFHLKRYSKSRRKAPIWWPLSTPSGTYTVWLAWPRLTRDTLFRVADELKRQKLPFETRRLTSLKQDHGPNPASRQRTEIAAQEDLVSELSALLEEVERVAPLWNPVHDDGVILHFALLWRMVRDAGWQKECRAAWEKLAMGDYDWAHLAMHLWPERVAPKCRTDRSLAIAHALEDAFWVEVDGKWRARDHTDAALAAAIAERSSAAVKAALRGFESAPVPSRGGHGRRGR